MAPPVRHGAWAAGQAGGWAETTGVRCTCVLARGIWVDSWHDRPAANGWCSHTRGTQALTRGGDVCTGAARTHGLACGGGMDGVDAVGGRAGTGHGGTQRGDSTARSRLHQVAHATGAAPRFAAGRKGCGTSYQLAPSTTRHGCVAGRVACISVLWYGKRSDVPAGNDKGIHIAPTTTGHHVGLTASIAAPDGNTTGIHVAPQLVLTKSRTFGPV